MSISAQGRSRLNWVWRWRRGFCSAVSPAIHILAGENVCIQAMTPTQLGEAVAARQSSWIDSEVVTTGFGTTRTEIAADASSAPAICRAWSSTSRSASAPYRCWLPVTNQTSRSASAFIGSPGWHQAAAPIRFSWVVCLAVGAATGLADNTTNEPHSSVCTRVHTRQDPVLVVCQPLQRIGLCFGNVGAGRIVRRLARRGRRGRRRVRSRRMPCPARGGADG
jgi:hypothetical protein